MRVTKSRQTGKLDCIVTIQDEELTIDFSVELGKEPIVTIIQDPKSDLKFLDILNDSDLLLMQDMALEEAKLLNAS
jgi:hypothetical protein